ncbi:MAG: DUF5715 family protein [Terriglobales bacterium]
MYLRKLRSFVFVLISLTLACAHAFGAHAAMVRSPRKSRRLHRPRRVVWNPVLRGSYESMLRQNEEINRLELPRIADEVELAELEARHDLVPIGESDGVHIAIREASHRYCRPWTESFLQDLGTAYYQEFGQPIQVNSAVRTVEYQRKLRRHNGNAAPEEGETASSHLAGLTIDINKRGLTRKQHDFIQERLVQLREQGLVEVAEERRQPVFHVMVSDRYTEWREANQLAGTKSE